MLAMGSSGWFGDASKIWSWGIATAELKPLGQGITAARGIVVVVVGVVVVETGTVVVVLVGEGPDVVVTGTVVGVVVVVVVVVAADGRDEKAPAGSTTIRDAARTPVSDTATTPRRRFHKALTAQLYRRGTAFDEPVLTPIAPRAPYEGDARSTRCRNSLWGQ